MHHYARINAGHFFVGPSKDITKFAKKISIELNFLWSTRYFDMEMLDNPWFHIDVDGLGLRDVSHISFKRHLINLNGCLKGLRWETRGKALETGDHFLMGREKRGTIVNIKPRRFLERHGLDNGFIGRKYFL